MQDGEQNVLEGMRQAGIHLVASVPDITLSRLLQLCDEATDIQHVPLAREEEGVGVCAGSYLGGQRAALIMENGGLRNGCGKWVWTEPNTCGPVGPRAIPIAG